MLYVCSVPSAVYVCVAVGGPIGAPITAGGLSRTHIALIVCLLLGLVVVAAIGAVLMRKVIRPKVTRSPLTPV